MFFRLGENLRTLCLVAALATATLASAFSPASWHGVLRDEAGKPIASATVRLSSTAGDRHYSAQTSAGGEFALAGMAAGDYRLAVESGGKTWGSAKTVVVVIKDGASLTSALQLSPQGLEVRVLPAAIEPSG